MKPLKPIEVVKKDQIQTPEQRRHALGLVRSMMGRPDDRKHTTVQVGDTSYKISVDKLKPQP